MWGRELQVVCSSISGVSGVPKWRPALAMLLVAVMTLAMPERARAQNFPESAVQIGSWTLVATAVSRTFQHCTIRRVQSDGFSLYLGLTPGGVQFFAASAPRWGLQARQTYPTSLTVGARQFTFTGMARTADALNVDAGPDFFAALQSGLQIGVTANQRHFTMTLDDFDAAMARLKSCAREYAGRTLPAASAPPIPPPQSAAPSASSAAIPAPRSEPPLVMRVTPKPAYPDASRMAGEEGTVKLKVTFRTNGAPQFITVEESSGYPALDKAATDAMKEARIEPYVQDGKPTPFIVIIPIRFQLTHQ